jgi:hypothetical protein
MKVRVSRRSIASTPRGTGHTSLGRYWESSAVTRRLDTTVASTIDWRSRMLVKRHHLV